MKEYESENVGVRFIEPVKETGRMNPTPTIIRRRQVKIDNYIKKQWIIHKLTN